MQSWYYWYREALALSRRVSTLLSNVRELSRQKTMLSNENSELRGKAWGLEREKTRMFNENRELQSQVSTLGCKARELQGQNTKLSDELAKQREDTRKAGLLFMDAADTYQQAAKKQIKTKVEELQDTRKASLLLMNAADAYQDVAKKQTKAKVEELEDMKAAVLVLMSAADSYQQEAKKQIKEKAEELKILRVQKVEMDARAASLESELNAALYKNQELEVGYDSVKGENNELRSEIERLMMELGALMDAGEAATKAFDGERTEIMKEFEDLRMMKVEETQANKDLTKVKNDKLPSEVLIADQND
ncbi:hypothetical protein SEVIR_3G363800v4 [Setaria viridis]|uniref:Uncharacterized protein n=1 Tax=Setaria viridis TaxID=4556 RepID=A0A4U6VL63_SETVI|nr:leucine zipper putative tumor suppressor 2-like [Setaria viridis]TKW28963.1 hypothetical protein SEVIR_3G363800v2 [Setaria viridis]